MTAQLSAQREQWLNQFQQAFAAKLPSHHAALAPIWLRRLLGHAADSDVLAYAEEDLTGLMTNIWRHWYSHNPNHSASHVSVFNPNIEESLWRSDHTAIVVITQEAPFIVDSIRLVLNQAGVNLIRLFYGDFAVTRNAKGDIVQLAAEGERHNEFVLYFEVEAIASATARRDLGHTLERTLAEVYQVVADFSAIQQQVKSAIAALEDQPAADVAESQVFLEWLLAQHFTFLACDEFKVESGALIARDNTSQGLFALAQHPVHSSVSHLAALQPNQPTIVFGKSSWRSNIHRPAYADYIMVCLHNSAGEWVGGYRFVGLYTSNVYHDSPRTLPIVRLKIQSVLQQSGFAEQSHDYKELMQILMTFPRDELIQSSEQQLLATSLAVLAIQERKQIRLFMRLDVTGQFLTALVYLPREIFNTEIRQQIGEHIGSYLPLLDSDFSIHLTESQLTRIRFIYQLEHMPHELPDLPRLEQEIVALARRWEDAWMDACAEQLGGVFGAQLAQGYRQAFSVAYRAAYSPRVAVKDALRIERLLENPNLALALNLYRPVDQDAPALKLKIFHQNHELKLSDMVPVLENFGLKVITAIPYPIARQDQQQVFLYDFELEYSEHPELDPTQIRDDFHTAFIRIWYGDADNDAFNQLILKAHLNWLDIMMLRAYAKYMKQVHVGISQEYIAQTLLRYPDLTRVLCAFFAHRFAPGQTSQQASTAAQQLEQGLAEVENLNEDRLLRTYFQLMQATTRTNFYQLAQDPANAVALSFKLAPRTLNFVPDPKPAVEVFVYSARMEGVHLRGGKVARGGLRWSDRYEDYRTEVLGLVKAQQVKNAIIVPVGAKGGFVAKRTVTLTDREAIQQEAITCYRMFIQGLLDITDNLIDGELVPPPDVLRHDEDDPYLVVAADKGTATFSDIANELSHNAGFWLGDAFASGGSNGYDHKKMGITARGAWVSVQRHFQAMGIDVQKESIRVIGIGDMAGDVFGNGLLQSQQVKLVAAFNHQHIFIDPDPDPELSFKERQRLFELPRSSWEDYDRSILSQGGDVLSRQAKSITLNPQMQTLLNTSESHMTPNEVIQSLLRAEVDLLWNGGIGTYIKAQSEQHADVGDKANDALRVNGIELGARVLGEGGNLGATQLGRIEYALKGGRCFTDFIDNSGGVDCSDHEVNIKICLDDLVKAGELTDKHRNQKLQAMTQEVAQLVLHNNAQQTLAIELAHHEARWRLEEYRRLLTDFEQSGRLDRRLEFLPEDDQISQRKALGQGLTRPELSVLIAYVKGDLKEALIQADAGADPYLAQALVQAFPEALVKAYREPLFAHRLRREIVATQLANDLFNHMSIVFIHRLKESTGASELDIVKAYVAARDVLDFPLLWNAVRNSPKPLDPQLQIDLWLRLARSVRRATRSLIKVHRQELTVTECVEFYQQPMRELVALVPEVVSQRVASAQNELVAVLEKSGLDASLLPRLALSDRLHEGLSIVRTAQRLQKPLKVTARVHILMGERLALGRFAELVSAMPVGSHWQALAREALRDDLDSHQQRLTESVLLHFSELPADDAVAAWLEHFDPMVQRWLKILHEIMATSEPEMSMYSIAGRELIDLVETSQGA